MLTPLRGCQIVLTDALGDIVARQDERWWTLTANVGDQLLLSGSGVDVALVEVAWVEHDERMRARRLAGDEVTGDVRVLQVKTLRRNLQHEAAR